MKTETLIRIDDNAEPTTLAAFFADNADEFHPEEISRITHELAESGASVVGGGAAGQFVLRVVA